MKRNWDDEFANSAYIPGSEKLPALWAANAAAYRQATPMQEDIAYGTASRNRLDLVFPDGKSKGLVVFVHGGFWMECNKSDWTDLAEGARLNGSTVALPGYTLAPNARISEITREISQAITKAAHLVEGPIKLVGHSAGGHLVTRMICQDSTIAPEILARITNVMSISGLHDLRLLQQTKMNTALQLDDIEAERESPALLRPLASAHVTCWVGADERPEFIRQSRLLAMMWDGLTQVRLFEEKERNHFSILSGLKHPNSPLMDELLAPNEAR